MNNTFSKPPLSKEEKEKRANEFLNFSGDNNQPEESEGVKKHDSEKRILKKEPTKRITIRLPESLAEDIAEISALTGLSMNSVILELIRTNAKQKLVELKS